jgi:flagellar protein FliO/FliZ
LLRHFRRAAPTPTLPVRSGFAAKLALAGSAAMHPALSFAAPGSTPATATPYASTAAGGGLQVLFGLIVVLGLMAGAVWLLKRFGPTRSPGSADIKVVGGVSVGNRERVVVVEVGDQWIVVGVAPGQVNALSTLPRQSHASAPSLEAADTDRTGRIAGEPAKNFSSWLKQTIDKRNGQ